MTLTKGQRYDVSTLRLVNWKGPGVYDEQGHRNPGIDAYDFGCYFTADGEYLGPDQFGVEPVCEQG